MNYKNNGVVKYFEKWNNTLSGYTLPSWDELPALDLYMDQVIILINQYLGLSDAVLSEKAAITPPMINNYVKLKIIPAPNKKKYSKIHIVYLIMVCILKQALSMATIQKILPLDASEEDIKAIYAMFTKNQHDAFLYISNQIKSLSEPMLKSEDENPIQVYNLIMQIAASANIFKRIAEDMLKGEKEESEEKDEKTDKSAKTAKNKQDKKKK